MGIVLGDKNEISADLQENFSDSNISHILAVSGMHLTYVILIFSFIFNNILGRKIGNIFTSLIILLYMLMTEFSPSVVRAGITGIRI